MKEAKKHGDLENIPCSKLYTKRMQKIIKKKKLPDGTVLNWKKDAGEYATRIWKWWKSHRQRFPYHAMAIRLVVIAQLSSCSVDRVFPNWS